MEQQSQFANWSWEALCHDGLTIRYSTNWRPEINKRVWYLLLFDTDGIQSLKTHLWRYLVPVPFCVTFVHHAQNKLKQTVVFVKQITTPREVREIRPTFSLLDWTFCRSSIKGWTVLSLSWVNECIAFHWLCSQKWKMWLSSFPFKVTTAKFLCYYLPRTYPPTHPPPPPTSQVRTGGTPGQGTPAQGWGTPHPGMGTSPSPTDSTPNVVLAMRRVVCLLPSRRRTFLFIFYFTTSTMDISI